MKQNITGYILWRGRSRLRKSREVVAIVTVSKSKNPKTGEVPQVWILDTKDPPHTAHKRRSAASEAICGNCKARETGHCYVQWHNAPLSVWRKFKRGGYPRAPLSVWRTLRRTGIRMGAAGDPAAIPTAVTRALRPALAYTHQWVRPDCQDLSQYAMASTDTPLENTMARALGWRTFQTTTHGDPRPTDSIACPYKKVQCRTCRLCSGNSKPAKSIQIQAHGPSANRYHKWRASLAPCS